MEISVPMDIGSVTARRPEEYESMKLLNQELIHVCISIDTLLKSDETRQT
jgi:hypothetical protein